MFVYNIEGPTYTTGNIVVLPAYLSLNYDFMMIDCVPHCFLIWFILVKYGADSSAGDEKTFFVLGRLN